MGNLDLSSPAPAYEDLYLHRPASQHPLPTTSHTVSLHSKANSGKGSFFGPLQLFPATPEALNYLHSLIPRSTFAWTTPTTKAS